MANQRRKVKKKVKVKQSVRLSNVKNNAANIGHRPALNNSANIKVSIKRKPE